MDRVFAYEDAKKLCATHKQILNTIKKIIASCGKDASRVQRVLERFHLAGTVDKASIVSEILGEKENDAPFSTRTEEGRLSGQGSAEKGYERSMMTEERPSVREKIKAIRAQRSKAQGIPDLTDRDRNSNEKAGR